MLGLAAGLQKSSSALLSYVKDNLKLYLDFKSSKSDTLKFPCEGSTSFDGSDDYIEVGDTATLSGLSALTISTWALTNDTGADQVLFSKNTDADWDSKSEYGVQFGSQDIIFVVYDIDNDAYLGRATTGNEITAGQWHHIACTWDGSTTSAGIKIFIDGIQTDDADANSGSGFVTIRDTATPALIGARHNDLSASSKQRFWDGKIANVGIWSRELSLEEIQSIMRKNYSQLKGTEKTSLVSWWALDDTNLTSELLTNHDFSDGTTGYSPNGFAGAGEGFSVSGGQATIIGDNLFSDFISVDTATALSLDNKKYQIVVDVESFTGTAWGLSHNGNVSIFGSRSLTTSGIHTYTFTWTAAYGLSTRLEANGTLVLNSVSIKEIQVEDLAGSNEGSITGATVTNSVYGGNAPVLDRAVDVAKEGQADAIGDGSALFVDSNTDYINMGDVLDSTTNAYSITAWIKTDGSGDFADNVIACKRDGSSVGWKFFLESSTNKVRLFAYDGSTDSGRYGATNIGDGEWHHVAAVSSSANNVITIYVDGINDAGTASLNTINTITNDGNLTIGVESAGSGDPWDGNIAQVGIWKGALTQAQIQEVMEQTYATMTPSIKSTLGDEMITNGDFSSATGWGIGSNFSIADGKAIFDDLGSGEIEQTSANMVGSGFVTGGLYKMVFTVSDVTESTNFAQITIVDDDANAELVPVANYRNGTHTVYFVAPSNANGDGVQINASSSSDSAFKLDDISIKKVTNDLVGYWALDELQGNAYKFTVPDSTGGEETGSELFTAWVNNGIVVDGYYAGWQTFSTDGQTVSATCVDDPGGNRNKVFGTAPFAVVAGTAYKITITVDSSVNGNNIVTRGLTNSTTSEGTSMSETLMWYNNMDANSAPYIFTAYTIAKTTGNAYFHVRQVGSGSRTINISAVSIKAVTGNYGALL